MNKFKIIAFTHKVAELNEIGRFHLGSDQLEDSLVSLKKIMEIDELMYLSTCNRVEFLIVTSKEINKTFLTSFFSKFNASFTSNEINNAVEKALVFEGEDALNHLFSVASSVDSLVVGEREIITQVRASYETCSKLRLCGDVIRIVIKKTIETAKQVYTQTQIAGKPVSVVSLAYRRLKELKVQPDARFLILGAGKTNTLMAQYLKKHKFGNFTVFNRTLANAEKLAAELKGKALPLTELSNFTAGFDVIISCTGSTDPIITKEIYALLIGTDSTKKVVVDLALPNDIDPGVIENYPVNYIEIETLKAIALENLKERQKELKACELIILNAIEEFRLVFKTRMVENVMKDIPLKVKEIREMAMSTVFAKELSGLDGQSKEVLDKILSYMEKKYISVPMKMAKDIFMDSQASQEKSIKQTNSNPL
ncbi:MAG: glutamyl-tRNA reductase [Bacteroidetes bacterium]|nr:glutamyl-tRNA reductase [Bacteroidota bacterium]HET6245651.1 glutamyl-tRNA reductase [Bacteroidia bacterium]